MADDAALGVVVMAYGTPAAPDDIEAYYTHIRRGRPPEPEQLADLTARYTAIGGISPLLQRTRAQCERLAAALEQLAPGRCLVDLGQKHASPFIEDAAAGLAARGASSLVGLVLAPHYSRASVGQYQDRLETAAASLDLTAAAIESWWDEPSLIEFLAGAVTEGLGGLPERTTVLFTAHSLPERALEGDPYPDQLRSSAAAVAARAGLGDDRWALAWQSAGRTPEPWRGPDILEVIDELAGSGAADGVLVCPQGFVSDHLEVLYDLDIEARDRAERAGLAFARTRVLNDDPTVFEALARRVLATAP